MRRSAVSTEVDAEVEYASLLERAEADPRVLGLVLALLISAAFGTSPELDAYLLAVAAPTILATLLADVAYSQLLPELAGSDPTTASKRQTAALSTLVVLIVATVLYAVVWLAAVQGTFHWPLFLVSLAASVLLHIGTNVVNEIYDVRKGVDTIVSPRASHAIVKGAIDEREAYVLGVAAFACAFGLGVVLALVRGWPIVALGAAGIVGGYTYTAPPFQYKFGSYGIPLVFALMGPLMVSGAFYAITGTIDGSALALSIPVGLLVAAILHGNEWRDSSEDARAGARTFSVRAGRAAAHWLYISLVVGAYLALTIAVLADLLPTWSLLAMLSLPLLVRQIRSAEFGASGQQRAIAMIDLQTAQLHAAFGYLMVLGLVVAAFAAR